MLLSLIIPIYKTEKFIEKCITSVCEQTLPKFEIILVDDCSPDNAMLKAKKILKRYSNRYAYAKFISLDVNQGLPNARKVGLAQATGKYIASLDSDDYMDVTALEKMLSKIQSNDSDILICDYYFSTPKNNFYIKQECVTTDNSEFIKNLFTADIQGFWWNKLYKKELIDEIKIYTDVHMQEDVLVAFQIGLIAKKVSYLPEALVYYVQYNNNSMTKNYTKKSISDLLFVTNFIQGVLENKYTQYIDYFNYRKLLTKTDIITYSYGNDRRHYFSLYEQDNILLPNHLLNKLSLYKKVFIWLVNKRCYLGINILLFIRDIKWKIFKLI